MRYPTADFRRAGRIHAVEALKQSAKIVVIVWVVNFRFEFVVVAQCSKMLKCGIARCPLSSIGELDGFSARHARYPATVARRRSKPWASRHTDLKSSAVARRSMFVPERASRHTSTVLVSRKLRTCCRPPASKLHFFHRTERRSGTKAVSVYRESKQERKTEC